MIKSTGYMLISLFFLLFSSCGGNGFVVEGTVTGIDLDGDTLTLKRYTGDVLADVSDAVVGDGEFEFEGVADEPYVAGLFFGEVLVMPLIIENGDIEVEITDNWALAKGTELNDAFNTYLQSISSFNYEIANVSRLEARMIMDGVNPDSAKVFMEESFEKSYESMKAYIAGFVQEHYEDILGPFAFKQWFGQMYYPMSDTLFKRIIDEAPPVFRNNAEVKAMME